MTTNHAAAADLIRQADYLLIGAGAGASADSQLKVFAQMSATPALIKHGVTYDQAASLDFFCSRPTLFYGFWVSSMRAYNAATPHDGYRILREWTERVALKQQQKQQQPSTAASSSSVDAPAAPYFVVTSNVDSMFKRSGIPAEHIAEVHGQLSKWQCGGLPSGKRFPKFERDRCCDQLFDVNSTCLGEEEKVEVDEETMELRSAFPVCPNPACKNREKKKVIGPLPGETRPDRTGRGSGGEGGGEGGGERAEEGKEQGEGGGGEGGVEKPEESQQCRLRPNVYLFGDGDNFAAVEEVVKQKAFFQWSERVSKDLALHPHKKLVIVEIGCGLRVPSIRRRCEELLLRNSLCSSPSAASTASSSSISSFSLSSSSSALSPPQAALIRINPEFPTNPLLKPTPGTHRSSCQVPTLGLKEGAQMALQAIDACLRRGEDENDRNKDKILVVERGVTETETVKEGAGEGGEEEVEEEGWCLINGNGSVDGEEEEEGGGEGEGEGHEHQRAGKDEQNEKQSGKQNEKEVQREQAIGEEIVRRRLLQQKEKERRKQARMSRSGLHGGVKKK